MRSELKTVDKNR